LFSTDDPAPGAVPTNRGFVINFRAAIQSDQAKGFKDTLQGTDPSEIMGMYAPEMLPIMSGLARGFAVCDQWFSSAPTQTIPNRTFAAAATSQGHLDNHVKVFTCPSIFGRLTAKNIDWAIYGYNRDPLTRLDFTDTSTPTSAISAISAISRPGAAMARCRLIHFSSRALAPAATASIRITTSLSASS
jgi:phospholipase C